MVTKDIGYWLKVINEKLKVKADADLKEHGLTQAQCRVLVLLDHKGGQATQKEIEDLLAVSHPTVVGIISRMEQSGYVTTWIDPKVQRSKMVQLTPKATAIQDTLRHTIREQERSMLQGLSETEIQQLEETLLKIYNNID